MRYSDFLDIIDESRASACRQVFMDNKETIKIRKEKTALKTLKKFLMRYLKSLMKKDLPG